jgi:hypothetical protein
MKDDDIGADLLGDLSLKLDLAHGRGDDVRALGVEHHELIRMEAEPYVEQPSRSRAV